MNGFGIATICGSMRYYEQMLILARELTGDGLIVLMPHVTSYVGVASDETKQMLDRMHFAKIAMSNAVYVVGSHRGESTSREIEYAKNLSLSIHYRFQSDIWT